MGHYHNVPLAIAGILAIAAEAGRIGCADDHWLPRLIVLGCIALSLMNYFWQIVAMKYGYMKRER